MEERDRYGADDEFIVDRRSDTEAFRAASETIKSVKEASDRLGYCGLRFASKIVLLDNGDDKFRLMKSSTL